LIKMVHGSAQLTFRFARELADRVIFIADGRIVEQGPPSRIFTQPESERLQSFLSRFRAGYRTAR